MAFSVITLLRTHEDTAPDLVGDLASLTMERLLGRIGQLDRLPGPVIRQTRS